MLKIIKELKSKQPTDISILIKELPKKNLAARMKEGEWERTSDSKKGKTEEVTPSNETALSSTRMHAINNVFRRLDAQFRAHEITLKIWAKPLSCSLHSLRLLLLLLLLFLWCGFCTLLRPWLFYPCNRWRFKRNERRQAKTACCVDDYLCKQIQFHTLNFLPIPN